jgi:hypothetical protein
MQLQEEHEDLLGLIAQQEVELNVFKNKMIVLMGEQQVEKIEEEVKEIVEEQYGVYTNYRSVMVD